MQGSNSRSNGKRKAAAARQWKAWAKPPGYEAAHGRAPSSRRRGSREEGAAAPPPMGATAMTDPALERVWRSYMRFIVEEAHPDRYSIGPLIRGLSCTSASVRRISLRTIWKKSWATSRPTTQKPGRSTKRSSPARRQPRDHTLRRLSERSLRALARAAGDGLRRSVPGRRRPVRLSRSLERETRRANQGAREGSRGRATLKALKRKSAHDLLLIGRQYKAAKRSMSPAEFEQWRSERHELRHEAHPDQVVTDLDKRLAHLAAIPWLKEFEHKLPNAGVSTLRELTKLGEFWLRRLPKSTSSGLERHGRSTCCAGFDRQAGRARHRGQRT